MTSNRQLWGLWSTDLSYFKARVKVDIICIKLQDVGKEMRITSRYLPNCNLETIACLITIGFSVKLGCHRLSQIIVTLI